MATPTSTTQLKVIASAEVHRSTHKKSRVIIVSAQSLWGVDRKCDLSQDLWTLDRYIWFFSVCSNIAYWEYEHFYLQRITVALWWPRVTPNTLNQTSPSFHQTAHFELKHKVPSLIHDLLYNSYTRINAFTTLLCSKKQSHCNLLSHIRTLHIYIQVHNTC